MIALITLAGLLAGAIALGAEPGILPAREAVDRLRSTGTLSSVTVTGAVDLSRLAGAPATVKTFQIRQVRFKGPVRLSGPGLQRSLRIEQARFEEEVLFEGCNLAGLTLRDSAWSAPFTMRDCEIRGFSRLDRNRFGAAARFHGVRFRRRTSFSGSRFQGRAEFFASEFGADDPPSKATGFSNARFNAPALFNNAIFHSAVRFQAATFEQDAGFLNLQARSAALFRNVHFKGDAEFRFCDIARADFGDRDNLTLFAGRADFRGCSFRSARFEFTEFRGETSFVNARFGAAGASFRDANLGNLLTDFSGVRSEGPIVLTDAYFPALQFYWRELGPALLAAGPDAKVLAALHARLKATGERSGALDASYHLAHRRFTEEIAMALPPASQGLSAFLDAAGRRLVRYGEWLLWGWPTGYGTKLGRITLITLACWLLSAVAVAAGGRLLARITPAGGEPVPARSDEPLSPAALPEGMTVHFPASWAARFALALGFTFRLLFKTGPDDIRCVTAHSGACWRGALRFLWHLGSGLLLLLTLTLANSSPMISRLIGELMP